MKAPTASKSSPVGSQVSKSAVTSRTLAKPACERREPWAELDAHDLEPSFGQGQRCAAVAAADLEQPIPCGEICQPDEVVEEAAGIGRAGAIVEVGNLVERRPQAVPLRI